MQLVEVTISGFKSFAHKTTFQLSQGLTAVIGPNGSGKSNFTEAIRWVLGEQSLKTLRGRKSEDVIFAGSPTHPRGHTAQVTLTFTNDQGRLPLDTPEVALSRRLTRDGESEYLLNGDPVRLLDVQQLLAQAGMGTKSYTVISQGTVDRYLNATPAARRELFDEACGIKPLQLKVAQATRQLTQAEHEMEQLRLIQHELEPRLRVLKRQIQRENQRMRLVEKFSSEQATWFHQQWHTTWAAREQSKQAVAETQARVTEARYERDLVEQDLLAAAAHTLATAANTEVTSLKQQAAQAKAAYLQAQAHIETKQQEYLQLQQSVRSIRVQLQRAEAELTQARARVTDVDMFGSLRALLTDCADVLSALLQGTIPTRDELKELRAAITTLLERSATEKGSVAAAQTLVQHLEGPLQAVARLQALANERASHLAAFVIPEPPSREAWDTAERAVNAYQKNEGGTNPAASQEVRLSSARAQELAAERAHSTAQALYEQAAAATDSLQKDILREKGSQFLEYVQHTPPPATAPISLEELQALAGQVGVLGEIDPLAAREYEEVNTRYEHVSEQLEDLDATMHKLQQLIQSLTQQMQRQFRTQFTVIQKAFITYFEELFGGGIAELVMVETTATPEEGGEAQPTVLVEGIEIFVHPPGKKLQHIHLLSGGEKALTSLALLLAILAVQQPPFLVLDEVDAALDEANSHRFASLLKEKSSQTQCIVVSHNRETMAQADILYGITMQQDGVSNAYSIKLGELVGETIESNL